jgi:hypothetical protein
MYLHLYEMLNLFSSEIETHLAGDKNVPPNWSKHFRSVFADLRHSTETNEIAYLHALHWMYVYTYVGSYFKIYYVHTRLSVNFIKTVKAGIKPNLVKIKIVIMAYVKDYIH